MNPHIGEHRIHDAVRDETHRALDRFVRTDELRRPPPLQRELLEQRDVDVGTDTEREHTCRSALAIRLVRDARRIALTDRRRAIGDEQDDPHPLAVSQAAA